LTDWIFWKHSLEGFLISRNEGLDALDKLAQIMWLSVGVYEDVRKVVEGLG